MSSSNKRQSVLPKVPSGPKAPVNFGSHVTIADSAILTGSHTINISSESVIHPRARLESTYGRITIGRRCIVHERTHVGAPSSDDKRGDFGVLTEDYVVVEVGSIIESGNTTIGEGCHIGPRVTIGKGAKLGKHCTITAKSIIQPGEVVPDYTVVYSNGLRRTDKRGLEILKAKAQARQIEILRRLISSNPAKFKD
ncbi:trimeric LpxA-like protein [Pseudomassariella vexata]|uniref:Dynactin subunit 6 n=1 Tax=Pseudomassariella vexata TaxID=1141098 RepID=A0A1Y2DTC5_9PEZI|nr:trimeric LpxA-like protein [Pseudomassariella vexata]ORY62531.1 trimeric LpxA-like protein [Pseudomassariella vexata]